MKRRSYTVVKKAIRENAWHYAGAIAAMAAAAVAGFATPLVLAETLDAVIGAKRPLALPPWLHGLVEQWGGRVFLLNNLWIMALMMLLLYVAGGAFQYLRGRLTAQASESIAQTLRDQLYDRVQHWPYEAHVRANTGELIQKCTSDVETVRRFLDTQLVEIFRTVLMIVIAATVMLRMNAELALWSMVLVPMLFVLSFIFFNWVRKFFRAMDEAEGRMSQVLQENLAGVRVVRAFGRQKFEVEKFGLANDVLYQKSRRLSDLMAAFWPVGDLISMLQTTITLAVGVMLAARGRILVGEMTVFISYVSMLLWPVRRLGRILSDMGKAIVSADRIEGVLNEPTERNDGEKLHCDLSGDVAFEHVAFSYDGGKTVLRDVDFTAKKGQTIAVLGATGSGKSTMMQMLQRLYEPKSGRITVGGTDIARVDKAHLRHRVALILQEPFLYSRTIYENIAFGSGACTRQDVVQSAQAACADGFIQSFEKGYDTIVGERGVTLSGGQKQRVAIARALLRDADIVVFDDSLSAVDTETDALIRASLRARRGRATTFIISHRLTTLSQADCILVLDQGRIVQSGTHAQLIEQDGLYKNVYRIQNMLEEELSEEAKG